MFQNILRIIIVRYRQTKLGINKQNKKNLVRETYIVINLNAHIHYMNNHHDSMVVVDSEYKKKLAGFIKSNELSKELDDLLKYYDAKDVQPNLEKTKKILSKFNVNKELLSIRE